MSHIVKFRLEHRLPRRLRYARVYIQAGSASVFFSLDGTMADWRASIGHGNKETQLSDKEYSRLRAALPATQTLDDDGRMLIVRNSKGEDESWLRPRWTLTHVGGKRDRGD
jgi:hypothetical protein